MKRIHFVSAILMMACMIYSCDTRKPFRSAEGVVWNTVYHITYASNVTLDDSIHRVMKRVEMSLSAFNDSSVVSRINRNESCTTDSMFRKVFLESQRVNRVSGGAFDPTVGALVNLWGFGTDGHETLPPTEEAVDSARRLVGINECRLDSAGRVVKKDSLTMMNFSAIAKGYGADAIGAMMKRNGVADYMIEIGGEIAVAGKSPRGSLWRIRIDAPVESADSVIHDNMGVIEVSDCGIATSGNYRNYRVIDGKSMGHTINPFTGKPALSGILSATVIAPECMTADALATACMIMPLDSAVAMIESQAGVSAMFVTAGDTARWAVTRTAGFPAVGR